jgi:hypothetical protein
MRFHCLQQETKVQLYDGCSICAECMEKAAQMSTGTVHVVLLSNGGKVEVVTAHPRQKDGLVCGCLLQLLLEQIEERYCAILRTRAVYDFIYVHCRCQRVMWDHLQTRQVVLCCLCSDRKGTNPRHAKGHPWQNPTTVPTHICSRMRSAVRS